MRTDERGRCFNHNPDAARRRREARRQGGVAKAERIRALRAPAVAPDAPPPARPFELGPTDTASQLAAETQRVATALASGQLDPPRARLLLEVLRALHGQLEARLGFGGDPPDIGREPTTDECEYMVKNDGRTPPGVTVVRTGLRVSGPPWVRPPAPPEPATEDGSGGIDPTTGWGRFISPDRLH
jgi:hypothetical protein